MGEGGPVPRWPSYRCRADVTGPKGQVVDEAAEQLGQNHQLIIQCLQAGDGGAAGGGVVLPTVSLAGASLAGVVRLPQEQVDQHGEHD